MRAIVCLQQLMDMHRSICVLLLALCVTAVLGEDFDPTFSHGDFMRNFNKTYQDHERAAHEAAFRNNYAELLRLHGEGRDVAVNERLDWTDGQKGDFLNYKPANSGVPPSTRPLMANALFASPTAFDWRSYGVVTPIKNQGSCGSCWAFSSTAEYESKIAIATNGTLYDLSEQYVLKCQTAYSLGCRGGNPYSALVLQNTTGIPQESAYPYNPTGPTGDICLNTTGRIKLNMTVNGIYYYENLTVQQLQQDLLSYGPINVGVYSADSNFMNSGRSGLITCFYSNSNRVDHVVLLVGYNTTHWFVKNSWGTTWGNNGFGYISKTAGYDCNIRKAVTEMKVNAPPIPTDPNMVILNITMTDSFGDGWNGNILTIKQNSTVLGSFGGNFTNRSSMGPVYIQVPGNMSTQIAVGQMGAKSNQIGFIVKAPNGTIIYQRTAGSTFDVNTVFFAFCPAGGCPNVEMLTIAMSDSAWNGWNGNVLAIKQNQVIVGTFGSTFTTGTSSGPIYITVKGSEQAQIVVKTLGNNTRQIGFVIRAFNGTVIHQRFNGSTFSAGTIFNAFCPIQGCPTNSLTILTITMTDSFGDGWNNNIISLKQNNSIVGTFDDNFTNGSSSGPIYINVVKNIQVQLVVTRIGTKSQEIGFVVKNSNGTVFYQRSNGTVLTFNNVLTTFCPIEACLDLNAFNVTITMTDSYGDGWEGTILGIKQNGVVKGTFGDAFTSGSSSGPVYITVQGVIQAQIVVIVMGNYTKEVGFIVKAINGTVLHQRQSNFPFETSIFRTFCLSGGCPSTQYFTLTVTMTDSAGDGWNQNYIGFRQNNTMTGVFGNTFISGWTAGPVYVVIQGKVAAEIVVSQFGTKSKQIGFIVKAPNGTIIHQRYTGTAFDSTKIFATFCPAFGCQSILTLFIFMSDAYSDGWEGTILGVKQNGTIVKTFGNNFTSGSTSGPVQITIIPSLETQIIVVQFGGYTSQIGFIVTASNWTKIYQRINGTAFTAETIFITFCAAGICSDRSNATFFLTTTDVYGDGWQGTVLSFKNNGTLLHTFTLMSGFRNSSISYALPRRANISIGVYVLGNYTNEIGFTLVNSDGYTVFQRTAGNKFFVNSLLGTFCPECLNLSPVSIFVGSSNEKAKKNIDQQTQSLPQNQYNTDETSDKSQKITIYALISILVVFAITIAVLTYFLISKSKKIQSNKSNGSISIVKQRREEEKQQDFSGFRLDKEK